MHSIMRECTTSSDIYVTKHVCAPQKQSGSGQTGVKDS